MKKLLLTLGGLTAVAVPAIAVTSCGGISSDEKEALTKYYGLKSQVVDKEGLEKQAYELLIADSKQQGVTGSVYSTFNLSLKASDVTKTNNFLVKQENWKPTALKEESIAEFFKRWTKSAPIAISNALVFIWSTQLVKEGVLKVEGQAFDPFSPTIESTTI